MALSPDGKVRLTMIAPETAPIGTVIPLTMHLQNTSARPVELYLRGREMTFDFLVSDADSGIVWRRLDGEVIPAILRLEVLLPGQQIEMADNWDQSDDSGRPVVAGAYSVRGTVLTDGSSTLEAPSVVFRIDPK